MSDSDKCPTCGIARDHDGPHYYEALKQAGKPMCPDPFHDAVSGAIDAPSPDKVRGILGDEVVTVGGEPHIPLEVANRRLHEVERELQTCKFRRESWKALASKYKQQLDIAHTRRDAALSELARTKRQLNTLREAVGRIASGDYGEDDEGANCCPDCSWYSGPYTIPCERHTRPEADEIARDALASLDEQEGE